MKRRQINVRTGSPLEQEADAYLHCFWGERMTPQKGNDEGLFNLLSSSSRAIVKEHEPLHVGGVVITGGGEWNVRLMAHVSLGDPESTAPAEALSEALPSALYALDMEQIEHLVVGDEWLGTAATRGSLDPLAQEAVQACLDYAPGTLRRIDWISTNRDWIESLRRALSKTNDPE